MSLVLVDANPYHVEADAWVKGLKVRRKNSNHKPKVFSKMDLGPKDFPNS